MSKFIAAIDPGTTSTRCLIFDHAGNVIAINESLMQFQSDILDVPVIRPKVSETTALVAAYAAGLAVGFRNDHDELRASWGKEKEWHPAMDAEQRKKLYSGWKKPVTRMFDWVE